MNNLLQIILVGFLLSSIAGCAGTGFSSGGSYPETECPTVLNKTSDDQNSVEITVFSDLPTDEISVMIDGEEVLHCTQIYPNPLISYTISFEALLSESGSKFELINHTRGQTQNENITIGDYCCVNLYLRAEGWEVDFLDEPNVYE
ncbi:MAG: hypothetical protein QNJ45_28890 [Ardenticatenaceae bacterium]|nr:hypothetical protein [Ardenticatenaceae bacterium]